VTRDSLAREDVLPRLRGRLGREYRYVESTASTQLLIPPDASEGALVVAGEQTEGRVTHFVTGIGTSGTVMGTGRRLKDYRKDIEVWAVEPDDALHGLEGLKHMESSIVPPIYHPDELNGVIAMPTDEAWDVSERLAKEEGILVGHSSGGSLAGALRLGRKLAASGKPGVIVTLFPDRADRYFEAPVQKQHPVP